MSNSYLDTTLVDKAIIFATNAHKNSERRAKAFPYIIHPLEAMAIVATMSNDPELLAAAVLHDTVEDTNVTIEDIRREFGDHVANIVAKESVMDDGKITWKERKQMTINRVKKASLDGKIVALGDKLSNMRAIYNDYQDIGDKLWERFHCQNKEEVGWYYKSLGEALSELKNAHAYKEYIFLVNKVFN